MNKFNVCNYLKRSILFRKRIKWAFERWGFVTSLLKRFIDSIIQLVVSSSFKNKLYPTKETKYIMASVPSNSGSLFYRVDNINKQFKNLIELFIWFILFQLILLKTYHFILSDRWPPTSMIVKNEFLNANSSSTIPHVVAREWTISCLVGI